eukprot:TRINITY_DN2261_c0_g2_i1.p1 TRINITY_DN2261_c0_g2~~TRINITY_DN2261_c0_g2_i1.p1  ORF type:complete len:239 (-),score=40.47 TRINITY_DN2261_c0_g2_i1:58-774(-)
MDHNKDGDKDEEIFKERLYLGTREPQLQRLARALLGFYHKIDKGTYEESYSEYQTVLRDLSVVEMSLEKANIVSTIGDRELKEYLQLYKEREDEIQQVIKEIENLKSQLAFERTERTHREEYALLTQILSQHPPISKQQAIAQELKNEINTLTNQSKQIDAKIALRSKQFQLMLSALQSLQENEDIVGESVDKNVVESSNPETNIESNGINTNTDSMMTDEEGPKKSASLDTDVVMAT